MKRLILSVMATLALATWAFGADGTMEGPAAQSDQLGAKPGPSVRTTDETYLITPFESVSISQTGTWPDNRHRAYFSGDNVNGFLLFDVSQIPDTAQIISMTLRCNLENAFGSPYGNPVVDVYYSGDDNWTRTTATPGSLSLDVLLQDNVPFSSYVPTYDFVLNAAAHDWTADLLDNRICIGFKNDVTYYSYVYFFGAYGSPVGPPPELTIVTGTAGPPAASIELVPVSPPIMIPANGGSFDYNATITNHQTTPLTATVWTNVTLPGGTIYGPVLGPIALSLPGSGSIVRLRTQVVPGSAPAGGYSYHGYIGPNAVTAWDTSSFPFTKLAAGSNGKFIAEWQNSGQEFPANTAAEASRIVKSGNTVVDLSTAKREDPIKAFGFTDDELLSNGGFETGTFPPWTHDGAWTISTTSPHTGTYSAYDVGNHWLRQDIAPTPASQIVSVTLWCRQPEAQISAIDFFYEGGNYSEDLIWPTASWQQFNVTSFIDPGMIVTGIRVWGYSGGPVGPDETFFDDISVQTAGTPNVSITMVPVNPPIIIPAGGGNFNWNGTVTNNGSTPSSFQVWVMVTLPNGSPYGPVLGPLALTLSGGASLTRLRTQSVPASAPPGNYVYIGNVGNYPGTIYDSDSFTFVKSTTDAGGSVVPGWSNSGEEFAPASGTSAPATCSPLSNRPNPFNPSTTIRFELPQAARVHLQVFDASGRLVTTLVSGWREAGTQEITFEGNNLPSGIYIYRVTTNEYSAAGKMLLMK